jgi:hypothetical protein
MNFIAKINDNNKNNVDVGLYQRTIFCPSAVASAVINNSTLVIAMTNGQVNKYDANTGLPV